MYELNMKLFVALNYLYKTILFYQLENTNNESDIVPLHLFLFIILNDVLNCFAYCTIYIIVTIFTQTFHTLTK